MFIICLCSVSHWSCYVYLNLMSIAYIGLWNWTWWHECTSGGNIHHTHYSMWVVNVISLQLTLLTDNSITFSQKTVDSETIIFDCQRLWQIPQYLFWFNLTWTLPLYLRHGNVISSFTVVPMLKDGTAVISVQIDNVTVPYIEVW